MKIALSFPGVHQRGGVERIVFECARFLAARHEVTVFANDVDPVASCKIEGDIQFRRVPMLRWPRFLSPGSFLRNARKAMEGDSFDAVGSFGCVCPLGGVYWAQSVHAAWLKQSAKYRGTFTCSRWKQRLNPLHPVLLRLERKHFSPGGNRKVIALTEQVRSDLIRYYDVASSNIVIIPNGFAPDEFDVDLSQLRRNAVRAELGYVPGDRVVVFVANEIERKGLRQLLHAVSAVNRPDVRVLAVGRLNQRAIAKEIENLGLVNRVRFTGPTSEAAKYYAAGDVFALPTQYEAWGLVILEALACGLPVLTSRLAGASIAVVENKSGQLIDDPLSIDEIAAKLRILLDGQHDCRQEISRSVAHYSWSKVLVRYEQLLIESAQEGS